MNIDSKLNIKNSYNAYASIRDRQELDYFVLIASIIV